MSLEKLLVYRLKNGVQHYSWGDKEFIPDLLGITNPQKKSYAELWMGAHPNMPSTILLNDEDTKGVPLNEWIASDLSATLGDQIAQNFNHLPFLFKVLSANQPLSIKVHPDKKLAEEGFARENDEGIALDAFNRTYKDPNHKPEIFCALTPFWALRGFRYPSAILELVNMSKSPLLKEIANVLLNENLSQWDQLKAFFIQLLNMDKENSKLLVDEVLACSENVEHEVFYWVKELAKAYPGDSGALAPIYLNLFHLLPGEAFCFKAGVLHCYLKGCGVELEASSDNELRGGLTHKHIAKNELLKMVQFVSTSPKVLYPTGVGEEKFYETPFIEFSLSRIVLEGQCTLSSPLQVSIIICIKGEATLGDIKIKQGDSIFLPSQKAVATLEGNGIFFRASVPDQNKEKTNFD